MTIFDVLGGDKSMISLLLSAAAVAAQPQLDCNNPITQTDMTMCAGRSAKAADAAMVSEYKVAKVIMGNMDRDINRKYDKRPSYSAALLASQRAWLKFRAAECVIEGYSARGGSMEPMIVNGCYEEVTKDRTTQLKELRKSYIGFGDRRREARDRSTAASKVLWVCPCGSSAGPALG